MKKIKIDPKKAKFSKGKIGVKLTYKGKTTYGKDKMEALGNLAKKLSEEK